MNEMRLVEKAIVDMVTRRVKTIADEECKRMLEYIDGAYKVALSKVEARIKDEIPEIAVGIFTSPTMEMFRERMDTHIKITFNDKK